jgi:heme-degrading monooxygenase HmoA
MLCAHTVRRLKPGTFDEFAEKFAPAGDEPPPGWVRFHMLRNLADENEVVTFGFFDGTLEELERSQNDADYDERRAAIAPLVETTVTNGVFEVVTSLSREGVAG